MTNGMNETTPNLTEQPELIAGLDYQTEATKPRRKRRTKEEIAAQASGIGGSVSGKLKRDLEEIRTALGALFAALSMPITFYNQTDGRIFLEKSPDVIEALLGICRTNDKIREMFLNFAKVSGYSMLANALLMMIIPIAANHGLIPGMAAFVSGLSDETMQAVLQGSQSAMEKKKPNANASRPMGNV